MIVCVCRAVSDTDVAKAIEDGAKSVADVACMTGAGTGCGRCQREIAQALDMARGKTEKPLILLRSMAALVP